MSRLRFYEAATRTSPLKTLQFGWMQPGAAVTRTVYLYCDKDIALGLGNATDIRIIAMTSVDDTQNNTYGYEAVQEGWVDISANSGEFVTLGSDFVSDYVDLTDILSDDCSTTMLAPGEYIRLDIKLSIPKDASTEGLFFLRLGVVTRGNSDTEIHVP